ncbi:MAG: asparaginase domain-containing protein [Pseudomonadota bacterium]
MKILILTCGGTIISPARDGSTVTAEKARPEAGQYMIEELKGYEFFEATMIEKFGKLPEFKSEFITDTDSTNVGPDEWRMMVETIVNKYDQFDGFLLAHGTNSLAYTASALSFALPNLGKPVIVTGSNVAMGLPWSDGPANASNSILTIGEMMKLKYHGVFTVFANKIISGVRTKKSSGVQLDAFRTFNRDEDVGKCIKDKPIFNHGEYKSYRPWLAGCDSDSPWKSLDPAERSHELREVHTDFGGNISSHTFHPGDNPQVYELVIRELARLREQKGSPGGMIIRAVGDGDVSSQMQKNVYKCAQSHEIPVVVTTQEPHGVSRLTANRVSKDAVKKYGAIPAHDMSIETMVIKLRYLMSRGLEYDELHSEFLKSYLGEVDVS